MMEKIYIETLLELEKYNQKLTLASEDIVNLLREQREDKALGLFISAIDGFNWVLEVISYTKFILEEYDFIGDFENINEIFKEMIEALQNQDYVLLGDLIEYEMVPFLKDIQSTLDKINIYEILDFE